MRCGTPSLIGDGLGPAPATAQEALEEVESVDFREVAQDQVVEEDRIGHDSALDLVVWEREVGNTLVPDQGLPKTHPPDAFDDPNRLSAFRRGTRRSRQPFTLSSSPPPPPT